MPNFWGRSINAKSARQAEGSRRRRPPQALWNLCSLCHLELERCFSTPVVDDGGRSGRTTVGEIFSESLVGRLRGDLRPLGWRRPGQCVCLCGLPEAGDREPRYWPGVVLV